jgi:glycosyltransferase involved in cell wall biosynthesis
MDDANIADGGNGVTIGRVASVLAEETGLCATLRAPADLPRGVSDFDAFLNAGDFALCVVLHAFKCGDALDALAEVRSRSTLGSTLTSDVKVVLVLGGTDVNVDAREAPERAATLARRAAAADVVVAFSPSMVAAAPSGALPPTTVIVPQGVRLPSRETLRPSVSETTTNTGNANTEDVKEEAEETLVPSLHDALGVATSTRVFLLPAGLRPVKDVLWAADAVEERVKVLASSSTVSSSSSPAFVLAVIGPSLDAPYASLVAQKARASYGAEGARAFTQMPPVARRVALEYMRAAAGVLNTSLSEGQSGALLEAAALGTPVLARDVPGNRALLDMLEEASLGADPGGADRERDPNAFRDDFFDDDDSSPLLAAYAHPCGFLFASPETLAEAMSLLAEDSDVGSAVRRAAGRAADRARRGAEELARREREGWRGVAAGLFAGEK